MRLRICNLIVASFLIVSIGGHWALLQSVAWMGMIVSYSQQDSLAVAVEKTFDGQHPCGLCKAVKHGKETEGKQTLIKSDLKINWMLADKAASVWFPIFSSEIQPRDVAANLTFSSPALPPPRRA